MKYIKFTYYAVHAALALWLIASWLQVGFCSNPALRSAWNFFDIVFA